MESVNEGIKLIAQAQERIKKYLEENDIQNELYLYHAIECLNGAIDKLTTK